MNFSELEYLSIENQKISFPKHYHETFCISLIQKGVEQIDFETHSIFTEAGSISITNPYEIHANPVIDTNSFLSFDTIYVPNDLMKHALNGESIQFINRIITSKKANNQFELLKNAIDSKDIKTIHSNFTQFAQTLKSYSHKNERDFSPLNFSDFKHVNDYIENHICDKFNLDELSKMANINKFGFVKKFKLLVGMSPMNYILMRKIFSSKKSIHPHSELKEIAYQYNFTDLAHYSRTFKKFVGISPKKYREGLVEKIY